VAVRSAPTMYLRVYVFPNARHRHTHTHARTHACTSTQIHGNEEEGLLFFPVDNKGGLGNDPTLGRLRTAIQEVCGRRSLCAERGREWNGAVWVQAAGG
jgi:hypothetical protein